jgi:LmbE family N-acetylglucosaminyl deacetylase
MTSSTRRQLLANGTTAAVMSVLAVPTLAAEGRADRPSRILVVGGHPGDPEAGCGGTMALYARKGHEVSALYLTRGEAGIQGKSHEQAGATRTAEALAACKILGARALFAGQMDGAAEVNPTRQAEFTQLIKTADADVVFTQWPIDTHPDHRACANLTLGAWVALRRKFALYYYEVDLGSDTLLFRPTHHVDVTATEPLKRQACMAHASQDPDGFYNKDHVPMLHFRGMESGHKLAEAFIHQDQSPLGALPRI